jgi:prolyl oligopeptidase
LAWLAAAGALWGGTLQGAPPAGMAGARSTAAASAPRTAIVAPAQPVTDHIGPDSVTDNYRWMEDTAAPGLQSYLHAASEAAAAVIGRIGGRERLVRDLTTLDAPAVTISALTPDGETVYYLKRGPTDDVARLMLRRAAGGAEKLLVDPETVPDARPHSEIDQFVPSLDGNFVAYGLEDSGPDSSILRIYDATRNVTLPERIDGARFAQLTWRPDSAGFYYTRAVAPAAPRDAQAAKGSPAGKDSSAGKADLHYWGHLGVFMHMLGTDTATDVMVLDGARLPFAFAGTDAIPRLLIPPASDNALAIVSDGVSPSLVVATVPLSQLGEQPAPWQMVAAQADGVTQVVTSGSLAFLLTSSGAPTLRVATEDLADPGFEHSRTVVAASGGVITGIAAAQDALYVARRQGAAMELLRLDYRDTKPQPVRLPFAGTIAPVYGVGAAREWGGLVADPRSPGALFSLQSWAHPLAWERYDTHGAKVVDTGLLADPKVDPAQYDTVEMQAVAADGTKIPLSVVSRKGVALDHARPTLVAAYGSYGYAYDARYYPLALAWADQGGVFAVAHVRGGGELGEAWHQAGTLARKMTAATDMLACANALIQAGYTDRAHLAGMGTNAGALAVGNAITRDPGMFRAVVIRAGLTNPLRVQDLPGQEINLLELGDVHIPLQQEAVLSVDPYAQVKDGLPYPAVLLTTSANDAREPVWESAKMAARLQAATTSGRPVLLLVAFDQSVAGPTQAQLDAEEADDMAFLLWQLEVPGFVPEERVLATHRRGRGARSHS